MNAQTCHENSKKTETTTLLSIFVKKSLNIHLLLEQSANENLNVPQVNNEAKEKPKREMGISEEKKKKQNYRRNSNDFWVFSILIKS